MNYQSAQNNINTSFIQEMNPTDLLDTKSFGFTEFDNNVLFQSDNNNSSLNTYNTQQPQQQQQAVYSTIATPQPTSPAPLTGVYSNTGFDMIEVLSRLSHR